MSNVCISVEFLAGTSIDKAAEEAIELVNKMEIAYVRFNFNGVDCSIGRNATVEKVVSSYMSTHKNGVKFMVCNS